ncbi:MAG: glycosyltransferase family 4 protein [Pseudomonadota bacterium]
MRIGILSYPLLFQREAGVQLQIRETTRALNRIGEHLGFGLQVELLGPHPARLEDYDLIHVFSAAAGNHRIVEAAYDLGVPVVLTPLVSTGWNRACGAHARLADHRHGTPGGPPLQSNYAQTRRALQLASVVIALGETERKAIEEGFLIDPSKLRVFPNGVSAHLFEADGELFRSRTGMRGPFVLMDGPISPYRNQLGMAEALADIALPFVLLGEAPERDQEYLREVRAMRGVTCLGGMRHDPRMLASAYAAASVLVLPGQGDCCAHTVFDALAAGTPVVMSEACPLDLPESGFALHQVTRDDALAQQKAVLRLIAQRPERESVRALVRPFTWERAAAQIAGCYIDLVNCRSSAAA